MKRFTLLSIAAAVLTACGGSGSVDLGDEYAGLGWRPVDLATEGVTKIYATDYLLSELDEWTFPEGLTVKWQQDSAIWRVEGRMKQPLGVASIEAAGGTYHLVLRQAPVQEVEFSLPLNPGDSSATAYLIGTFNAWNRSSHPMARDTANVARLKLNLKPGRYEYKFTVGGIEVNDPNNPTKVPNGLGGANDVLVVAEPGQNCAPIQILDEREGEVAVKALPKGQELIAFWNTYQVSVRSAEDGSLRVAIPSEAGSAERHRLEGAETLGHRNHPLAVQAREFRIAAVMHFGETATGDEHVIAGLVASVGRGLDHAREIDAPDQRVLAQDLAGTGRGERVLVVDVRVHHAHDDLARRQIIERELFKPRDDLLVDFVDAKCLETPAHDFLRDNQTSSPSVLRATSFSSNPSTSAPLRRQP